MDARKDNAHRPMKPDSIRLVLLVLLLASGCAAAQGGVSRSSGQTLYLPIYSHIWHGD